MVLAFSAWAPRKARLTEAVHWGVRNLILLGRLLMPGSLSATARFLSECIEHLISAPSAVQINPAHYYAQFGVESV